MNRLESIHLVSKSDNLEKLKEFEINHFQIPNSFKDYLINYNVAKPRRSYYKQDIEFNLNYLFGFSPYSYEDFIHIIKTYTNRMNENLFPIGSIDGGDLLCMSKSTEEIFYWNHEIDDKGLEGNIANTTTKISTNINEFLEDLITSSDPTEYEIKKAIENAVITTTPKGVEIRNAQRLKKGLRPLTIEEWHAKLNGIYDPDQISSKPTEYEIQQSIKNSKVLHTSDDFDELFAQYLKDNSEDKNTPPYKIINGKNYTKEEWEAYESEEYKKYIDKRNKKTSSLFVEENLPQDFALETNGLKEIKHFVMNSRSEQVPVYQYPSTMVAPITFLPNGTVVEVLKKGDDGWCEVLSKDGKKGFIQSNFVKDN